MHHFFFVLATTRAALLTEFRGREQTPLAKFMLKEPSQQGP